MNSLASEKSSAASDKFSSAFFLLSSLIWLEKSFSGSPLHCFFIILVGELNFLQGFTFKMLQSFNFVSVLLSCFPQCFFRVPYLEVLPQFIDILYSCKFRLKGSSVFRPPHFCRYQSSTANISAYFLYAHKCLSPSGSQYPETFKWNFHNLDFVDF